MQPSPLLEKLDWIFTSSSWTILYPNTSVSALDMIPFDHCPCILSISTSIPKNSIFRFENYWLKNANFPQVLNQSWGSNPDITDKAKLITAKLKNLRKDLKEWQRSMQNLKTLIANVRMLILFLEVITDFRDLSLAEWNFHKLLEAHLLQLLEKQRMY